MKKSLILTVLTVLTTSSVPAFAGCAVALTKVSIGKEPFSQTAEIDCSLAKDFAKILNERHNNNDNGLEPVVAIVIKR